MKLAQLAAVVAVLAGGYFAYQKFSRMEPPTDPSATDSAKGNSVERARALRQQAIVAACAPALCNGRRAIGKRIRVTAAAFPPLTRNWPCDPRENPRLPPRRTGGRPAAPVSPPTAPVAAAPPRSLRQCHEGGICRDWPGDSTSQVAAGPEQIRGRCQLLGPKSSPPRRTRRCHRIANALKQALDAQLLSLQSVKQQWEAQCKPLEERLKTAQDKLDQDNKALVDKKDAEAKIYEVPADTIVTVTGWPLLLQPDVGGQHQKGDWRSAGSNGHPRTANQSHAGHAGD